MSACHIYIQQQPAGQNVTKESAQAELLAKDACKKVGLPQIEEGGCVADLAPTFMKAAKIRKLKVSTYEEFCKGLPDAACDPAQLR
jgi:hypothetical protein